jgi:hypothetical protein
MSIAELPNEILWKIMLDLSLYDRNRLARSHFVFHNIANDPEFVICLLTIDNHRKQCHQHLCKINPKHINAFYSKHSSKVSILFEDPIFIKYYCERWSYTTLIYIEPNIVNPIKGIDFDIVKDCSIDKNITNAINSNDDNMMVESVKYMVTDPVGRRKYLLSRQLYYLISPKQSINIYYPDFDIVPQYAKFTKIDQVNASTIVGITLYDLLIHVKNFYLNNKNKFGDRTVPCMIGYNSSETGDGVAIFFEPGGDAYDYDLGEYDD